MVAQAARKRSDHAVMGAPAVEDGVFVGFGAARK
jgi:hypothetical protein